MSILLPSVTTESRARVSWGERDGWWLRFPSQRRRPRGAGSPRLAPGSSARGHSRSGEAGLGRVPGPAHLCPACQRPHHLPAHLFLSTVGVDTFWGQTGSLICCSIFPLVLQLPIQGLFTPFVTVPYLCLVREELWKWDFRFYCDWAEDL